MARKAGKENGDTLLQTIQLNPKSLGIPEWINVEKHEYDVRKLFEESLDFLLHGKPKSSELLTTRTKKKEEFDTELFYQLIPDVLTSAMLDGRNKQDLLEGLLSGWMTKTIIDNIESIGLSGVKKIQSTVSRWESGKITEAKKNDLLGKTAGKLFSHENQFRNDVYRNGSMVKEYAGFKNSLEMALALYGVE